MDVQLTGPKGILDRIAGDEALALRRVMPNPDDSTYMFLRYIDPYDDTVFNEFQMPPVIVELDRVIANCVEPEDLGALQHLREMAVRCSQQIGARLRFIGD